MIKFWKGVLKWVFALVLSISLLITGFVYWAPQFGAAPEGKFLTALRASRHYKNGEFVNTIPTTVGSFMGMLKTIPDFINAEAGSPKTPIPTDFQKNSSSRTDSIAIAHWYGHSSFALEMDGKRILIEPVFGSAPSPIPFMDSRFMIEQPIPKNATNNTDIVIISHDHYDHLDYPTVLNLAQTEARFYTPLGVGSHLRHWGIPEDRIVELDWWEQTEFASLKLTACPSRHFSGRAITDRNATQWASWIIEGVNQRVFFSGDGGYGPHFKEIGDRFGPFDLAMMECGQYNDAWKSIHMSPEETVKAGIDVRGKYIMPIHWGAFQLSVHSWTDPIERFVAEAKRLDIPYIHPMIGSPIRIGEDSEKHQWWVLNQN